LRPPKLPLCRWTRTWSEALSVDQPGGRPGRDYVPNDQLGDLHMHADNFRKLREMLNEICAINAELLRRREELG
jgi:hypothetical protein